MRLPKWESVTRRSLPQRVSHFLALRLSLPISSHHGESLPAVSIQVYGDHSNQFRNTYDSDNVVFSPQGRLHQVEYASEAVKQGSAVVGLRSKTHSILLALKVCC